MAYIYSEMTRHMLEAAENILFKPIESWVKSKTPLPRISFRRGTGKSTYIRSTQKNEITYSFGVKAPESKHDVFQSGGWLGTREMLDRRYFNGELTYINMLGQTVLHEHCHVIQVLSEIHKHVDGSHNDSFYKILDRIHQSNYKQELMAELKDRFKRNRLPMNFSNGVDSIPCEQIQFWNELAAGRCNEPEVMFRSDGQTYSGEILKVSATRAKVILDNRRIIKVPKYRLFKKDVGHDLCRI
jgi:hypothetical protein